MENDRIGFDILFKYATLGIIVTNVEGQIVLANPFLLKQFGYTEEEVVGKPVEILIPSRFEHRHVHHRDGFNQHPHSRPMGIGLDLFASRKDGSEFPVEISLGTYKTTAGQFVIAFVSDISFRKSSENALKELNAELERKVEERTGSLLEALTQLNIQMQKEKDLNELKSRFVSMASHEFRTPLSTVLSSTFLISKYQQTEEQPQREKHIQRIVSAVTMMTDILNDFLSVGKIEEGKIPVRLISFDVEQHISSTVHEMMEQGKKQQLIDYKHTGDKMVLLDPSLLKHIVQNLLSNAIKFSPEHDTITVTTELSAAQLICRIKDNGIGIAKEDQQHLFERFFRGNNVSDIQGTGLGLHIVSKYAELMNGNVSCHSEEKKGTEFIVTFKTDSTI